MGQYLHNDEVYEDESSYKMKDTCPTCGQDIISVHIGWGMRSLVCRGKNKTCKDEASSRRKEELKNSAEFQKLCAEYDKRRNELEEKYPQRFPFFVKKVGPYSEEEIDQLVKTIKKSLWQKITTEIEASILEALEITESRVWLEVKNGQGYYEITLEKIGEAFCSWYFSSKLLIKPTCAGEIHATRDEGFSVQAFMKLALAEKVAEYFVENFLSEKEKFDEILCAETRDGRVQFKPDFGDRSNKRVVLYESAARLSEEGLYGVYFEAPEVPLNRKDKRGSDMFKRRVKSFSKLY